LSNGAPGFRQDPETPYAVAQILDVGDWDGSVERGSVTCSFSGLADANDASLLTAKGSCGGSLTIFDGANGYCTLRAKIGKALEIRNDCPT
jgi:hypothetical protein